MRKLVGPVFFLLFFILLGATAGSTGPPSGPWDAYNISPKSRTLYPHDVKETHGNVRNAPGLLSKDIRDGAILGDGGWMVLDFGTEVGGSVSFDFVSPPSSNATLRMTFTESPLFISPSLSDDSTLGVYTMDYDGYLPISLPAMLSNSSEPSRYTMPEERLRGGFRYLIISMPSTANTSLGSKGASRSRDAAAQVVLANVSVALDFMPQTDDLSRYGGYFWAPEDEVLTKAWWAGAYTTNVVPVNTGRRIPIVKKPGWANNATLGTSTPIIVDGAKRDRAVWPGDMGIAVPTAFVSFGDLTPVRNALSTMFAYMNADGSFPEAGPPLLQQGSDTYHSWTLIGCYNYYQFTSDASWLMYHWSNYTRAVDYLLSKVDSTALMDVTGLRDWARQGQGGHNAEAHALLYKVLLNSASLASTVANDSALSSSWTSRASSLRNAFNAVLWDEGKGMYHDNDTARGALIHPEDGNSLALCEGLEANWNSLGAVPPELPDTIAPFVEGMELNGHFEADQDDRAIELMRRSWGYMLSTNLSVRSTLLEGYQANGSIGYRSQYGYGYDPSYVSHSHGWSSAPTSALLFYVLGLQPVSPSGQTWSLFPHPSNLTQVQGGFSTSLGWFGASWTLTGTKPGHAERKGETAMTLAVDTPAGTTGKVGIPLDKVSEGQNSVAILVDGERTSWNVSGRYAVLAVPGGRRQVVVQAG